MMRYDAANGDFVEVISNDKFAVFLDVEMGGGCYLSRDGLRALSVAIHSALNTSAEEIGDDLA